MSPGLYGKNLKGAGVGGISQQPYVWKNEPDIKK